MVSAFFPKAETPYIKLLPKKVKSAPDESALPNINSTSNTTVHHDLDLVFVLGDNGLQGGNGRLSHIYLSSPVVGNDDSVQAQSNGSFNICSDSTPLMTNFPFPHIS